jgi:PAS domain S-box-containing protein
MPARILIVEDNVLLAKDLVASLKNLGYEIAGTTFLAAEAVQIAEESKPDLILMDIKLTGTMDGIEAADEIRSGYDIPIVYLTGYTEKDVLERAKLTEPYGYLGKPVNLLELRSTIETALYKHEADKRVRQQSALLEALNQIQNQFMSQVGRQEIFDGLLKTLLLLTDSEYGYIAQVFHTDDGEPYQECRAAGSLGRNDETRQFYADNWSDNRRFYGTKGLNCAVMDTGRPVISNDPCHDSRSVGLPKGHPAIHSFLALPIYAGERLVGTVGIANRPNGYDREMVTFLEPYITTCASIVDAYKMDEERKMAEEALRKEKEKVDGILTAVSDHISIIDEDHNIVWANAPAKRIFGSDLVDRKCHSAYHRREDVCESCLVSRVFADGNLCEHEVEVIGTDGTITSFWCTATVVSRHADGRPKLVMEISRDITDRKKVKEALRQEKENAERYLDTAGVIIVALDKEGRATLINRKGCEILGYQSQEIIGNHWFDMYLPEHDRDRVRAAYLEILAGDNEPFRYYENPVRTRNGEERLIAWYNTVLTDDNGAIIGTLSSGEDITERKTAEKALRNSEEKYRLLSEYSLIGIYTHQNGVFTYVNQRLADILGYSVKEMVGREFWTFVHPLDRDRIKKRGIAISLGHQLNPTVEFRVLCKDGQTKWLEVFSHPVNHFGNTANLGNVVDITERKHAVEALRKSEKQYRLLIENLHAGVVVYAPDTRILHCNQEARRLLGLSHDEMQGKTAFDPPWSFVREDESPMPRGQYPVNQVVSTLQPLTNLVAGIKRHRTNDRVWVLLNAYPVFSEMKEFEQVVMTFVDITERRQAEAVLSENLATMEDLVDKAADGFAVCHNIDEEPYVRFTHWNPRMTEITGYTIDEINRLGWYQSMYPDADTRHQAIERMDRMRVGDNLQAEEWVVTTKGGKKKPLSISTSVIKEDSGKAHILAIMQDITDRKQAEEQVKASLKEKEVLLREIHHRVKNNLAIVNSLLSLQSNYALDKANRGLFVDSQNRIKSMALAHEILYQSENLADINVHKYVANLVDYLVSSTVNLRGLVRVTKDIDDVSLCLDTVMPIGFVLTELVSNCIKHAFPERRQGEIRIVLRSVGERVLELVVADNGVGIPEDIDLKNSKSLGLELVDTFVSQLKGEIEIRREEGTQVRIRFKDHESRKG